MSLKERLILAGIAAVLCLLAVIDLVAKVDSQWPGIGAILALLIGCLMLGGAILGRSIVWIITTDGILIGEQHPFGKLHTRAIRRDDISEMHLRKDGANSAKFSLAFKVGAEDVLTSPPLPDVTKVHETTLRIAQLLALPDPEPADNPLDAINPEIRLGEPGDPGRSSGNRILIVLLASVLSVPFVVALYNGQLSVLGIIVWSFIATVAAVLFRYAYRMSEAFWVIDHGGIRIERLSLNGAPEVETIGRDDVEAIDVRDINDGVYGLVVKLRGGKSIRSPAVADQDQTRALRGEIIRRLGLNLSASQ